MRLIDGDALYEEVQHSEELATNRVLDMGTISPYPNNFNLSYIRDVVQMNERTRFKYMIADAPTIEPECKKGKWYKPTGMMPPEYVGVYRCSKCDEVAMRDWKHHRQVLSNFCPNCGADMRGEQE